MLKAEGWPGIKTEVQTENNRNAYLIFPASRVFSAG